MLMGSGLEAAAEPSSTSPWVDRSTLAAPGWSEHYLVCVVAVCAAYANTAVVEGVMQMRSDHVPINRAAMSRKAVLLSVVGVGLLVALLVVGTPMMVWDGGFGQVEYRVKFVRADGSPTPGVQLRVENEQGTNFFHYPVTDYVDGRVPVSEGDGVLTFHHVSNGPEFGGRCWELFRPMLRHL